MAGQPPAPKLSASAVSGPDHLHVMWVGDATLAERFASRRAPHIQISAYSAADAAAFLRTPEARGKNAPDLLVLDASLPTVNPVHILEVAESHHIDLPVVLLAPPGQENLSSEIGRQAVCDCIVKTQDFVHQILPVFEQVRARHDLLSVFRSVRDSEERCRAVLELQPAVVCVIDRDCRVTAMNRAGLALLGRRADKILGQKFTSFLPEEEQAAAVALIGSACAGEAGELNHSLVQLSSAVINVCTRMVPLPRADGTVALATVQDRAAPTVSDDVAAERDGLKAALRDATTEADKLRAELGALQTRSAETRRAADERHQSAIAEREAEQTRLNERLQAVASRCSELVAERASLVREFEQERDQLILAIQHATADSETLAQARDRREEASQEARERETQHAATIADLDAERQRLSAALTEARVERESHEAALAAERAAWEHAAQTAAEGFETRIAALKAECGEIAQALDRAAAERQTLVEREPFERERDQLMLAVQHATAHSEMLAQARDRAEEAAREAGDREAQHAATIAVLDAERQRLSAALTEARVEQESHEAARAAERAASEHAARTAREGLESRIVALEAERQNLLQALERAAAERQTLVEREPFERERDQLMRAVQTATAHSEMLAPARDRAEEAAREAREREAQHAAKLVVLDSERQRLSDALTEARVEPEPPAAALAAERAASEHAARTAREGLESRIVALETERQDLLQALGRAAAARQTLVEREHLLNNAVSEAEQRLANDATAIRDLEATRDRLSANLQEARVQLEAVEAHRSATYDALGTIQNGPARPGVASETAPERGATTVPDDERPLDGIEAVRARCRHLLNELTVTRAALADAKARADGLAEELDGARTRLNELVRQTTHKLDADSRDLEQLREALIAVLCDADRQCKALQDRQSTTRVDMERLAAEP